MTKIDRLNAQLDAELEESLKYNELSMEQELRGLLKDSEHFDKYVLLMEVIERNRRIAALFHARDKLESAE